jgi:uncharacterized membrane protein
MEISRAEFEQLLEHIRDLTARVEQLEQRLASEAPSPEQHSQPSGDRSPSQAESSRPPLSWSRSLPAKRASELESRIGSQWLNRVGIAAVLIGVSFFLNYAFENNWVGGNGRLVIGLVAGIALVVWSERFRKRGYPSFSYSLKAVGIGVLYLSLWASFQVYHLLSATVVFAAMTLVTAGTCGIAIIQDAEILALFAIAGGFSTPALLSTGENREMVLFSYVALLDFAILALTFLKPWRGVAILGFVGTLILYIAWYSEFYDRGQLLPTLIFASLFFAIFTAVPIVMLRSTGSTNLPLILALANGATFFTQGYIMLVARSASLTVRFALAMAIVYLLVVLLKPKMSARANRLDFVHLALAIGLITVAIPIRLESHAITIGWLVESGALLWVGARLRSQLLSGLALTVLALGVARLLLWDNFEPARLLFNARGAVYAIAIAALGFAAREYSTHEGQTGRKIAVVAAITLNVLALRALSLEVSDYYWRMLPAGAGRGWRPETVSQWHSIVIARDFTYSALWMLYGAALIVIGFWRRSGFVRWQALILIALTAIKVFVYDTSRLDHLYRILSFVVLGILLLAISFAYQRNWIKLPSTPSP